MIAVTLIDDGDAAAGRIPHGMPNGCWTGFAARMPNGSDRLLAEAGWGEAISA
jgi:hypothetical protein